MRIFVGAVVAAALSIGLAAAAEAKVRITVDLASQTMHVQSKDQSYDWKVSSGKAGYETPPGNYKVLWMDKDHHSDEYEQAYMPNAIFFAPGFAIHGFGRSPWGHRASHGCVRLPMAKSAILFDLVKAQGAEINVVGAPPSQAALDRRARDAQNADNGADSRGGKRVFYNGVDGDGGRRVYNDVEGDRGGYSAAPPPAAAPASQGFSLFGQVY